MVITKHYDKMLKLFNIAITYLNCPISSLLLGDYYKSIKDIDNMLKYYSHLQGWGNSYAYNRIGDYHYGVGEYLYAMNYYYNSPQRDLSKHIEYQFCANAIKKEILAFDACDDFKSISRYIKFLEKHEFYYGLYILGRYYQYVIKDYNKMKSYYECVFTYYKCIDSSKSLKDYINNNYIPSEYHFLDDEILYNYGVYYNSISTKYSIRY